MKIMIKLKRSSSVDLKVGLFGTGVTDVKISGRTATCTIPQEKVAPGGKIEDIFNTLGGTNDVSSITLTK